jgi:hydrogenase-4 component F
VFVRTPLAELPLYLADRYFVLDATSMLFLLVINSGVPGHQRVHVVARQHLARCWPAQPAAARRAVAGLHGGDEPGRDGQQPAAAVGLHRADHAVRRAAGGAGRARLSPRRVAWHYLLYSSMSLAITLPGHPVPDAQRPQLQGLEIDFALRPHGRHAARDDDGWQRLGLALMLFGLGSKLGLAPIYSWLPETYEAAPTSTSALLAAVQFNISIVAVLRVLQVFRGQDTGFVSHELLIMGCLSLTVAAVQVMAARNYKRLIAYACVSSSGVIAIGLSVGKAAAYGVLLYVVSAAFVKALLFLTAGRLRAVYRTNDRRRSAA